MKEPRILAVALEGIENVLKAGGEHVKVSGSNQFATILEQEGGLDKLEPLQMHPNHQIYERALKILEDYFTEENDGLMLDIQATTSGSSSSEPMAFKF